MWTSATVLSIEKETGNGGKRWSVEVEREGGRMRTFKVDHVVMALGIGSGIPKFPDIPGKVSNERVDRGASAHNPDRRRSGVKSCTPVNSSLRQIIWERRSQ